MTIRKKLMGLSIPLSCRSGTARWAGPEAMNTYFCRSDGGLVFMVSRLAGGARAPE
jgi:hypothetical protein